MSDSQHISSQSRREAPTTTSTSLLNRVKDQDPEAWTRLVELYGPMVYRWCRESGLKGEDAGDVVQEVFGSVVTSVDDFRGARPGSFRAWLRTITKHRIHDYLQRRKGVPDARGGTTAQQDLLQVPEPIEPSTPTVPPPKPEDALWRRALELVRAEFEDRTWQAFWRVAVDEQRPADVADELGMTIPAVYQAKSRVLRRVRGGLGELEADA
jgi:RNA polymerase sigma-70 factor (ECF subfamily)